MSGCANYRTLLSLQIVGNKYCNTNWIVALLIVASPVTIIAIWQLKIIKLPASVLNFWDRKLFYYLFGLIPLVTYSFWPLQVNRASWTWLSLTATSVPALSTAPSNSTSLWCRPSGSFSASWAAGFVTATPTRCINTTTMTRPRSWRREVAWHIVMTVAVTIAGCQCDKSSGRLSDFAQNLFYPHCMWKFFNGAM